MELIQVEFIVLIAVLYGLGKIIKNIKLFNDKYIPLILLVVGIGFGIAINGLNVDSIIQGILVTTVTVFGNEVFDQLLNH